MPKATLMLSAGSLWKREVVRFLRQRSRVMSAIGTPLLFWLLLGTGMAPSFQAPGSDQGYLAYFFPGSLLLILLFTSIFSTISLIEDRRDGFLQSVLVSPSPRGGLVLGKMFGGTTLAGLQGILFLVLAPAVGFTPGVMGYLWSLLIILFLSLSLSALGFWIAWRMDSIQGFHGVMNLLLMPMWFLSGALFPADGVPAVLSWALKLNPLSYGLNAFRSALDGNVTGKPFMVNILVIGGFAVGMFLVAAWGARKTRDADLR